MRSLALYEARPRGRTLWVCATSGAVQPIARSLVGGGASGSWRERDRRPAQVRLVDRSLDAAGKKPLAQPLGIKGEKVRDVQDEAVGIGVEAGREAQHVLQRVVGGVTDVGLSSDQRRAA